MTEKVSPTFDNVLLELEFFKRKCEVLEQDLCKSQTLLKKNSSQIKQLQDNLTLAIAMLVAELTEPQKGPTEKPQA